MPMTHSCLCSYLFGGTVAWYGERWKVGTHISKKTRHDCLIVNAGCSTRLCSGHIMRRNDAPKPLRHRETCGTDGREAHLAAHLAR